MIKGTWRLESGAFGHFSGIVDQLEPNGMFFITGVVTFDSRYRFEEQATVHISGNSTLALLSFIPASEPQMFLMFSPNQIRLADESTSIIGTFEYELDEILLGDICRIA